MDAPRGQSSKHLLGKIRNKTIIFDPRNNRWNEQQEREGRSRGGNLQKEKRRKEALRDTGSRGETYPRKPEKGRQGSESPRGRAR